MPGEAFIILEDCKRGDVVTIAPGEINGMAIAGLAKLTEEQKKALITDMLAQNENNNKFMKIVKDGVSNIIAPSNKILKMKG